MKMCCQICANAIVDRPNTRISGCVQHEIHCGPSPNKVHQDARKFIENNQETARKFIKQKGKKTHNNQNSLENT